VIKHLLLLMAKPSYSQERGSRILQNAGTTVSTGDRDSKFSFCDGFRKDLSNSLHENELTLVPHPGDSDLGLILT
jgi:hypothetical protein